MDCTCQTQDEIQSAPWKQSQVSVFSAAFWQSETLHSQVIASDNSVHYKETLITYLDLILLSKPATLKALSIWSYGARSQFKHKYTLAAIAVIESKHDSKITWNVLATSHGKGPVDGIGAAKHNVWIMVKTPQNQVANVTSFTTASESLPDVEVIAITSDGKGPDDGIGAAKRHVWNSVKTPQNQVTNVTSFTTASESLPNVEVIAITSDGKGPDDGIGAAKRHVWNSVKTPQNQVTNATSFTTASETMPNVEVIEMILEMINNTNKDLGLDDVFKNAVILQSIANVHCVNVNGNDINMCVCIFVCMCVCMYLCTCVCMCI